LVAKGFMVYTIEKSSDGDNMNLTPCENMGYFDEIDLFKAGYRNLLHMTSIDTNNIFLFGHSLGGLAAPQLAELHAPKGIVVYGTVLKPWCEYLLESIKIQLEWYGQDKAGLTDTIELIKPIIYDYFYSDKTEADVLKLPNGLFSLQFGLSYDTVTKLAIAGRTLDFHRQINQTNIARAWKNSNCKLLAMYGEADIAANNELDHVAIVNYVNSLRPNSATFKLIPETNHTFQKIGTMQKYIEMQSNPVQYELYAGAHFNYELFDEMTKWIALQEIK
jgi:uncharacterized protein